jgi:hypothetical protein
MRRKTRRQKVAENPKNRSGKSRYALKVAHRQKVAAALGFSDMPWPVLNLQTLDK